MAEALFRTLHMIGIIGLAAGTIIVLLGTSASVGKDDLTGLFRVYLMTGASVLIALFSGIMLWLYVGKPAAFFSGNPVFHTKISLFVVYLAILLYPAWQIHRRAGSVAETIPMPRHIMICQKLAVLPLLVMPILAYLMARGIGY